MQHNTASAVPYFFQSGGAIYNNADGGGPTALWMAQPDSKPNQYPAHWENNGGYHIGGNFGPGQVQSGGGQNRVQVGGQQPQQPSQPTPTSTPPGGIHGDMNKPQALMPAQNAPMNYGQRPMSQPQNFATFTRTAIPQQPMRQQGRHIVGSYNVGMLAQSTTPALVQAVQPSPYIMYGQQRPGTPQQYTNQPVFMGAPPFYSTTPAHYYQQQVIPQSYQQMPSGGQSPQAGAQQQLGGVHMMRPNLVQTQPPVQTIKQEPKKRIHAIKIIDPDTHEEVAVDETGGNNNNITPTRSNDSSARETPQPNAGVVVDNTVAAEFAARVAARAMAEDPSPAPPPDLTQDSVPVASESDVHHKQQPILVPSSEKTLSTLSTSSEEFVPRSQKPLPTEPAVEEQRTPIVPTVSAETNSPAVEIQRKEPFPALKMPAPSAPVVPVPIRVNSKKQKGNENERQQQVIAPINVQVPPPPIDNKDAVIVNSKKGSKVYQKEEVVQLPPKERREKTRSVSKEQSPAPLSPVVSPEVLPFQLPEVIPPPAQVVKTIVSVSTAPVIKDVIMKTVNAVPTAVPVEEPPLPPPVVLAPVPASKAPQQQNGESAQQPEPPAVTVDGNKGSRAKNKKPSKMKDLNRKGVEKEGSDMDAFTTEPTIVNEERSITPVSSPPMTPPPETTAPLSPVDKIKVDLEEREDKLVAAKNEENTKVSALSKAEEEPAPVIEKPAVPQLTLRHSYKKDQWSPLNPEGKKRYERDFLFDLKHEPQSLLKPANLPDVVAVIGTNNMRNQMNYLNTRGDIQGIINPPFMQRSSQSQRGQSLPKGRGSQQGSKSKNNPPKVIHMSLSLHEDVKLKTVENAWKPNRLEAVQGKTEDEKQTEELLKNVRGILNKLTPQKFDTLMKKVMLLPIDSENRLIGVIGLIFDKAVDEPNFSKAYANMCKMCSKLEVTKIENGREEKVNFRKLLITRCQQEFESNKSAELDSVKCQEEINNCTDAEKKKELQLQYEEKERQLRMKSVGNIRFIGELFKLGMLTPAIMHRCIEHLLSSPDEESLECLCKLLTTIGKDLEQGGSNTNTKSAQVLQPYFQKMYDLAQKKENSKVSSRVRFMLQDVIDLRKKSWVPRRDDNNPKTIEQINQEAERESMEMTIALSQPPPRMNRQMDRHDDRKRGGNRGNNQSDDGWNTVGSSRNYNKYTQPFEASKMVKPDLDMNVVSLGGSSQYRFQPAKMESKVNNAPLIVSNAYSALRAEERKPPQSMNNRRVTPTPSIEKERQRMIQGALENDGRNSRGSSAQRDRPQPPSRDSSIPRQMTAPDNKETTERSREDDSRENRRVNEDGARLAAEKLERQTQTIFEEYLSGVSSTEDVKQEVEQLYPRDKLGDFLQKALEMSLEKKAGAQHSIGLLFTALMEHNLFSPEVLVEQLGFIYENADEIAIDVPKVWELQAHVIVPILAAEKINFSHFKAACSPVLHTRAAPKLLVPVLNLLAKDKGAGFVRKVWDSSNVTLKDFLPAETNVDAFMKDHAVEYLTGEAPQYENQVSMDEVQQKMLRLMTTKQPYENILDFILSNAGDKVEDLHFIRALITAICEACLSSNFELDKARFQQYEKLIQRFVDTKEDRELVCLSAVHLLLCRLQHPQGLIKNIFNLFLEDNLISVDSFLKWKESQIEQLENKGVSLYALTSFFSALEEAETDDENS